MTPVTRTSLEATVEGCRKALRRRVRGGALLAGAAGLGLILPLGWLLAGARGWERGSPLPLLLWLGGGLLALVIVRRLLRSGGHRLDEGPLASEMERNASLPDGSIRARLELARGTDARGSSTLARAGEEALLERLPHGVEAMTGETHLQVTRTLRMGAMGALAVALVALLLWTLSPDRSRTAWSGLVAPVAVLLPPPLPELVVEPGSLEVPRGEVVEVTIVAEGRREVTLEWESPGARPGEETLVLSEGLASASLPPIEAEVVYRVRAPDGATTPDFTIRPADPLLFGDFLLEVDFPDYTDLPPQRYPHPPGELDLPVGSLLRVSGRMEGRALRGGEGETGAVRLRDSEGRVALEMAIEADHFEGEWRPTASGELHWEVAGDTPAGARLPQPLQIHLVEDQPPMVALETEGGTRTLPGDLRLPLEIVATDDWGLDWVELEVVLESPEGVRDEPIRDRTPTENRREVALRPVVDLSGWSLEAGSVLELRARAADRGRGPGVTESPPIRLHLPDAGSLREGAREGIQRAEEELAEIADRARSAAESVRERHGQVEAGRAGGRSGGQGGQDFDARDGLRSALEDVGEVGREVERLRDDLARARENLPSEGELAQRIEALEALLAELEDEEMEGALQALLRSLTEGGEPSSEGVDSEAIEAWAEAMEDRMADAMERFRQAALESAFEGAGEEAGEIAAEQAELQEALREDDPGAAGRQEALEARAEALQERLDALERELRQSGDPEAADALRDAGEALETAGDRMGEAAQAARGQRSDDAGERAERAREEAERARDTLDEAQREWRETREDRVREGLLRGAHEALALSRIQGEIQEDLRAASSSDRDRLLAREVVLAEGIRNLGSQLLPALREAGVGTRPFTRVLDEASLAVQRSADGLRTGASPRAGPFAAAGQARGALNETALLLLATLDRLESEGEGEGESEAGDLPDELQNLAGDQEAMLDDARDLAGNPGDDGASARMEELTRGQDAVAGALGELAERFGGEEDGDPLGEMAELAREIAEALGEGRLDGEVMARQEELLDRLLDAGRSFERGVSEEREGTPAGEFERPPVRALPQGLLEGSGIPLPSAEVLRGLPAAERRLVLDYFERLNRRDPEGRE